MESYKVNHLKCVVKCLNILVNPVSSNGLIVDFVENVKSLDNLLSVQGYESLKTEFVIRKKQLDRNVIHSSLWNFVSAILSLLDLLYKDVLHQKNHTLTLKTSMPPKNSSTIDSLLMGDDIGLSIDQISVVTRSLHFVVRLGICSNLAESVGIPLQNKSKTQNFVPEDWLTVSNFSASTEDNGFMLSACVMVVIKLFLVADIKTLVIKTSLNDILAGLFSIIYVSSSIERMTMLLYNGNCCNSEIELQTQSDEKSATGAYSDIKQVENVFSPDADSWQNLSCFDCLSKDKNIKVAKFAELFEFILLDVSHDDIIRELLVLHAGIQTLNKISNKCVNAKAKGPPDWIKKACNCVLLRLIKGSKGIKYLHAALTNGGESSWKMCGAVAKIAAGCPVSVAKIAASCPVSAAKIAASCPVSVQQTDGYIASLSSQLLDLLEAHNNNETPYSMLIGAVSSQVNARFPTQFAAHFHQPLLHPLQNCVSGGSIPSHAGVVMTENELCRCLNRLYIVYVSSQPPLSEIAQSLNSILRVLWMIFCSSRSIVWETKHCVRQLLLSYLNLLDCKKASICLRSLSIGEENATGSRSDQSEHVKFPLDVCFKSGNNGGLQAVLAQNPESSDVSESQQVEAIVDILHSLTDNDVTGELFILLLEELTIIVSRERCQPDIVLPVACMRPETLSDGRAELLRSVTLLHLISAICEAFEMQCLSSTKHIFLFIKASLERSVLTCNERNDCETALFHTETMAMTLGLLTAIMTVEMDNRHSIEELDIFLPYLCTISDSHPDRFIQEMASDIRIEITTRGTVFSSLLQLRMDNKAKCQTTCTKSSFDEGSNEFSLEKGVDLHFDRVVSSSTKQVHCQKPLIEELDDKPSSFIGDGQSGSCEAESRCSVSPALSTPSKERQQCTDKLTGYSNQCKTSKHLCDRQSASSPPKLDTSQLQRAFEELCDPLIPVRGHALNSLTKLVEQRDAQTLTQWRVVQKVFEDNLHHNDTYIYLAAISGLAALADCFPESVISFLSSCLSQNDVSTPSTFSDSMHRLKLGEVLMRATRNLGEIAPLYRDLLLGIELRGAKDKLCEVRASSLSNLAELCHLLRFSLAPVLYEVFECCCSVLEHDASSNVRQAAALTLTRILEGLDKDVFTVLDSLLSRLYNLLKKVHGHDPDPAVRLHANMALRKLDAITRAFLFPVQKIEKCIQVISNGETLH